MIGKWAWFSTAVSCALVLLTACTDQSNKPSLSATQGQPTAEIPAAAPTGDLPVRTAVPTSTAPKALSLRPLGEVRALPNRILGASAEALIEHLIDDPRKVAIARDMNLAFVRFPGGSQANYYDWKTGLLAFEVRPNSSDYTRFWAQASLKIRQAFPNGISMNDYKPFADTIGAEVVLVPNLETATVADQVAWFESMKANGQLPAHIELGNEFWIAMGNDPNVIKKWPDEPTSMQVMRQYYDAVKPLLPIGAKAAVQAVGSSYFFVGAESGSFGDRLARWDADLRPEPWFDAVTLHLYTRLNEGLGPAVDLSRPRDPSLNAHIFSATMARAGDGVERVLDETEHRLLGKEIWVTEWNPDGASYAKEYAPVTPAMHMQLTARMIMSYLHHPSITMSLFFTLNFTESGISNSLSTVLTPVLPVPSGQCSGQ